MSDQREDDVSDRDAQINALLDDELGAAEQAALIRAAADDPALASALADARQIKALLGGMPKRRAPLHLRRQLLRIARPAWALEARHWLWLRRAAAIACLPLIVILANLDGSNQPSAAEIEQGRRELALALSYLNQAGQKTNVQISARINSAMLQQVTRSTVRSLSQQFILRKEYTL